MSAEPDADKALPLGEPMLDHDLSMSEIHLIENGLLVASQAASKRMARMIRVLMGDPGADLV